MLTGPVPPPPAPAMPPNLVRAPVRAPKRRRRRSRRPLVIVVAIVVAVVAVVAVAAVVLLKASGITTGSGTATISWKVPAHGVGTSPKSLSGTVDGLTLIAKSTGVDRAAGGTAPSATGADLPVAHWSGTLGGKKFDLDVTESIVSGSSSATSNKYLGNFKIVYRITGTYGTDAVKGTATADPRHAGRLQFSGTVGSYHVKGTASEPKKSATNGKFRASFVVTG